MLSNKIQYIWNLVVVSALFTPLCITSLPTLVSALTLSVLGTLSITTGCHRLWAHGTYKAVWPLRLLLVLAHTLCCHVSIFITHFLLLKVTIKSICFIHHKKSKSKFTFPAMLSHTCYWDPFLIFSLFLKISFMKWKWFKKTSKLGVCREYKAECLVSKILFARIHKITLYSPLPLPLSTYIALCVTILNYKLELQWAACSNASGPSSTSHRKHARLLRWGIR